MRVTLGHFGVTLGSLWGHFRHLKATLDHFGVAVVHIGVTLMSFWDHFGVILGSLWDHVWITLGSCWAHFGVTLGSAFLAVRTRRRQNGAVARTARLSPERPPPDRRQIGSQIGGPARTARTPKRPERQNDNSLPGQAVKGRRRYNSNLVPKSRLRGIS